MASSSSSSFIHSPAEKAIKEEAHNHKNKATDGEIHRLVTTLESPSSSFGASGPASADASAFLGIQMLLINKTFSLPLLFF